MAGGATCLQIGCHGSNRPPLGMQSDHRKFALCRVGNQVPGLVSAGRQGGRRARGCDMFHTVMGGCSAITNVANLGNLSPGHGRKFRMEIGNELAHLCWERLCGFHMLAWLLGWEQTHHPVSFKLICLAGKGACSTTSTRKANLIP